MKLSDTSKKIYNESRNVRELDGLSSLESEESELNDQESNETEEKPNSLMSSTSIEPYYNNEEIASEEVEIEKASSDTVCSSEDNLSSPRYTSSQTDGSVCSSVVEPDGNPNDFDYTPTQTHFAYLLRKIFKKLAQLTQITAEFNRFKTELNTKLDGNHTEYEILVEDLVESVVREGKKHSMLVESLRNELVKNKREAAERDSAEIKEGIEPNEKVFDQVRAIKESAEDLKIQLDKSLPLKVKLSKTSITISIVLGVTLGLAAAYYIKYYLKLY